MRPFRELVVWQKAHRLTLELYKVTRAFPRDEQYGLSSQIRRSAASIGVSHSSRGWPWPDWRTDAGRIAGITDRCEANAQRSGPSA